MTRITENSHLILPSVRPVGPARHHRALFLSDLHLGARGCRADCLLEFLDSVSADTIYLVGDVFDNLHPIPPHWQPSHDTVVQTLLDRARSGTRIIYLPGNHDEIVRRHYGTYFGCIEVVEQAFHRATDGRSYLVLHGDICDAPWQQWRMITRLGSRFDNALRGLDFWLNRLCRAFGGHDARRIEALLVWGNRLLHLGNGFEQRLTDMARNLGQDGVICGHFHKAALHDDAGMIYANCGDWVDSLTAIVEDAGGTLRLLRWNTAASRVSQGSAPAMAGETPTMVA